MLKAAENGTIVELNIKTDAPSRIEYDLGGGKVVYWLAPRIESG